MSIPKHSSWTWVIYLWDHNIIADWSWYINWASQISNKYYTFSWKESSAQWMAFKPDWTKLYLVWEWSKAVHQYTLSTARDISNQWTVIWDKAKSVSDSWNVPNCVFFKPDWTIMYILQYNNRLVRQYNLSTAWDVWSAILDTQKYSPQIAQESTWLWFWQWWKYMYILSRKDAKVYRHTLSTARDTSTAWSSTQSYAFWTTSNYWSYHNLWFNKKWTQMFTTKRGDDKIEIYKLTTPWNLTTLFKTSDIDVNSIESDPMNLWFSDNLKYMYMSWYSNKTIYKFETSWWCYS